jgi:low affinity Fe/Cu permease
MVACTLLVPFGLTNAVTYVLSVAAIIITGVVLIQGYRDTAAIHAKLDEIIFSLKETRNDVVGLEHEDPDRISTKVDQLEAEATLPQQTPAGAVLDNPAYRLPACPSPAPGLVCRGAGFATMSE